VALPTGTCHICGRVGPLTYEHVPPRSAFNKSGIWLARGSQLFREHDFSNLDREQQQRGAGDYTLCAHCNNTTGHQYGGAYVDWARDAVELVQRAVDGMALAYPFRMYPLRVIKQVLATFFSVNPPEFQYEVRYLRHLVLSKRATGLPPDIQIYAGYTKGPYTRSASKSGLLNQRGGASSLYAFSEFTFPPFVFVMTFASPCPDARLLDITSFASHGYDDLRTLYLSMPVLEVNSPYPSDYRPAAEIKAAKGG
jgi:hypothetical protein